MKALLLVFMILPLCSCGGAAGKLRLVEGNFLESRSMHAEALAAYTKALSFEETAPYAEYALGSVYLGLEEIPRALDHFDRALKNEASINRELALRLHYNRGVSLFQRGDYAESLAEFRKALFYDGSNLEAKRNLELALVSMRRKKEAQNRQVSPRTQTSGGAAGSGILFDFIRQKEGDRWRSLEWKADADEAGPDY